MLSKVFLIASLGYAAVRGAGTGYLPGVAPHDYVPGEDVELKVNKLTSVKTQLPYDFYSALPFCAPKDIKRKQENLGEIIKGDRIRNSLYRIKFLETQNCAVLGSGIAEEIQPWTVGETVTSCTHTYSHKDLKKFTSFVKNDYRVHWVLDSMPAAMPVATVQGATEYSIGFPLGYRDADLNVFLNNHVSITIRYYNQTDSVPPTARIVGFEVIPASIPTSSGSKCKTANSKLKIADRRGALNNVDVEWTYSVRWVEDHSVSWYNRWERYFAETDTQVHWFSIMNSIIVVLFLSGVIATILLRALHADLRKYSEALESKDSAEETGWKLVHGDVFRTPANPSLLSVLLGSGAQLFSAISFTLVFAVIGFLSPANSGAFVTALIILVFVSSVFSGYASTRVYKMMRGISWKRNILMTAFLVPGIIFAIFLFINFFIWGVKSSGGVTFTALLLLMALWFGISLPLVCIGAFIGFKQPAIEYPVGVNQLPRNVPPQPWYMRTLVSSLMGGALPFAAVFIELLFIFDTVWGHELYYIFGFIFVVFVILIITCGEISIVMTYFQLCAENYHWWWRSFLISGSSGAYFFAYSAFYFVSKLDITGFVPGLLYFGYSAIFAICFAALTGFIGFMASFFFIRKIYASLPFD